MKVNRDKSKYSLESSQEIVDIPNPIKIFFKQRGKYFRAPIGDHGERRITYSGVIGRDAEEVPSKYHNNIFLIETVEEYDFSNTSEQSKKDADRMAINAIKSIFGPGNYSDIRKTYMINTSTRPIKIRFKQDGRLSKKVLYVKQPDTNRIIGHFFYDLISGHKGARFGFNQTVFLEEAVPGSPLSRLDEQNFMKSKDYREGLMRAAVHADFLQLYSDVRNHRNRLIDSKKQTRLFDFNLMFGPKKPADDVLLQEYFDRNSLLEEPLINAYLEERLNVARRAEKNYKNLCRLAKLAGNLADVTRLTIDERVNAYNSVSCLEKYFEKKIFEYRTQPPKLETSLMRFFGRNKIESQFKEKVN